MSAANEELRRKIESEGREAVDIESGVTEETPHVSFDLFVRKQDADDDSSEGGEDEDEDGEDGDGDRKMKIPTQGTKPKTKKPEITDVTPKRDQEEEDDDGR